MNIDYEKIDKVLNDYAINKIYDILSYFKNFISTDVTEKFENAILNNKIINVNKPSQKDTAFFNNSIPYAHGPRTKNDGMINIYPYLYKKNTDEIINTYINEGIITHELMHFIIILDFKDENKLNEEFGHYINEGMVQLFTEQLDKKKFENVEYRKNIELAEDLLKIAPIDKILSNSLKNILSNEEFLQMRKLYIKQKKLIKKIEELVDKISTHYAIDSKTIIRSFKRKTTRETFDYLRKNLENLENSNIKNELLIELDNIEKNYYKEKEVIHKL